MFVCIPMANVAENLEVNICMICNLNEGVFNTLADRLDGEGVFLHEALEFVTCSKVEMLDSVTNTLCTECNVRLLDAYRFKTQALESYKALRNISALTKVKCELDSGLQTDLLVQDTIDTVSDFSSETPGIIVKCEVDTSTDAVSFLRDHHWFNVSNDSGPSKKKTTKKSTKPKTSTAKAKSTAKTKLTAKPKSTAKPKVKTPKIKPPKKIREKVIHDCKICGKVFRKKSNLIDHVKLHNNEKNFACSYCEKKFVKVANLRAHERIHTKERPYKCTVCPKAYNQSSSLKIHIRTHTQEKNYTCPKCKKAFASASILAQHKLVHDPSKHSKCEFCNKRFAQKINLKVHQKKLHSKELES